MSDSILTEARDEEFEEYFRHIIGDQCITDRNEMAQSPEGITELLHHDKLSVPLAATLLRRWRVESSTGDVFALLCRRRLLAFQATLRLKLLNHYPSSLEFPDLYIGCYRKARYGSVIVSFKGKDQARVESAIKALH